MKGRRRLQQSSGGKLSGGAVGHVMRGSRDWHVTGT